MQANVFIVPAEFADEAEKICADNRGPLPVIYRSKPGEAAAPPLATDSDIRSERERERERERKRERVRKKKNQDPEVDQHTRYGIAFLLQIVMLLRGPELASYFKESMENMARCCIKI